MATPSTAARQRCRPSDRSEIPFGTDGKTLQMEREEREELIEEGALDEKEPLPLELRFATSDTGVFSMVRVDRA